MSHGQPRILFLTLSDDVGSERIVSEMGRRGAACAVLGRPGAIAGRPVCVSHHLRLPSHGGVWGAALGVGRSLDAAVADWRPDAVVPLDDMAAGVLRALARAPRTRPRVRLLLERSLGDPRFYPTACSRALLIEAAAGLGICVPAQRRADDLTGAMSAAAAIGFPLMLKREGTCGGSGVTLVADEAALSVTFRAAARKARAKRALRRMFGFRRDGKGSASITLQARVAGTLALRTVACAAGRVLGGVSFAAERLDPAVTGSSTVVRPIEHPEMEAAARRVVEALGCSGFVSFDFIVAEDGRAHLIEMNARPVGSGHLGARFGHDLYGAWLASFPGFADADPPAAAEAPRAVALFPKEMARDPAGPGADLIHDVPWDEPGVIAGYRERLLRRHPQAGDAIARRLGPVAEDADAGRWRVPPRLARLRT